MSIFETDPVLANDAAAELADDLDRWEATRRADAMGRLADHLESRAAAAKASRDKIAAGRFAEVDDLPVRKQRLWYKFHGQMQGYDSAAKTLRKSEASARLAAEL